ncbi:hypothetical protein DFP72DRAFT_1171118 [Ephemerocybe angulata]|uniref:F-box domain-containing protein n=1 Tax=Ephemerocybe angulata TaxID=980116 RepID=A0A8H6M2N9_9AGAR|nr:hypothetical protein DFP72DRAFT_1171118 [Tulosesus angulatus]
MNRLLPIQEILHNVCSNLDNASLFSMALTNKYLLEPSLDTLWRELDTFQALVSCMPRDMWIVEDRTSSLSGWNIRKALYPARAVTLADLDRYITFYAPRIRSFKPYQAKWTVLSLEALEALHLATEEFGPGALSPLLTKFEWPSSSDVGELIGEESAMTVSRYMSLFLGDNVTSLKFDVAIDVPLHKEALEKFIKRCSRLKIVEVGCYIPNPDRPFIETCITSYGQWKDLKTIQLPFISAGLARHLASLPSLQGLSILDYKEEPILFSDRNNPLGNDGSEFPSLQSLTLNGTTIPRITGLLRCLPRKTAIVDLEFITHGECSPSEFQEFIEAVSHCCDPLAFTSIHLWHHGIRGRYLAEEPLELDLGKEADISPLFAFKKLEILKLSVKDVVRVTPEVIAAIPTAFPKLVGLQLSSFPCNRHPCIDHTHFLHLLQNCPFLADLSIAFDTSGITAARTAETACNLGAPFPLEWLDLGNSPIYSPSQVLAFLVSNCPNLTWLAEPPEEIGSNFSIMQRRWHWVRDQWWNYYAAQNPGRVPGQRSWLF